MISTPSETIDIDQHPDVQGVRRAAEFRGQLQEQIGRIVIGQSEVVDHLLISLFSGGHSLLVGVPGLAKTLLVKTLSQSLGLSFRRIQFTPDLMPSDITGTEMIQEDKLNSERKLQFIAGPLFAQVVLADEINRTPPKTQSALLEAMQEHQVTVAGQLHHLPAPFFVLATQNPIEQEGTYPLPEAQLDRFMFMISLDYPSYESELDIVKNESSDAVNNIDPILDGKQIMEFQSLINKVPVADNVVEYAVSLVHKTRPDSERAAQVSKKYLEWGAGPRASQFLIKGAKCNALLNGKYSPDEEDVKAIAEAVLRHRIVRNFKAEAEEMTIGKIIKELL